jgi:hypothetical protein
MTKINFVTPTLALIIVAMGFFIAWQCSSAKVQRLERSQDNKLHQQRISQLQAESLKADSLVLTIKERLSASRAKDSVQLAGLKQANSKLTRKLTDLRPPIVVMSDSVPLLKQFIQVTDSLLTQKDLIITHLEMSHSAEVVDLEAIIKAREDQILVEATKGHLWEEVAVKVEKEANQQRRRKGFWKVTSAVLAGGIVWISLKQ